MKPAKAILVPAIVVLLIDDTAACVGTTPALEYERYGFLLQAAQGAAMKRILLLGLSILLQIALVG